MKRPVIAALTLAALCIASPSAAQTQTRRINLRYYYSSLRQAVCYQQWNRAIALADAIIASDQLPPQNTDQMIAYQFYLEQYRRNETEFSVIPGCEGYGPNRPVNTPSDLPRPNQRDRPQARPDY